MLLWYLINQILKMKSKSEFHPLWVSIFIYNIFKYCNATPSCITSLEKYIFLFFFKCSVRFRFDFKVKHYGYEWIFFVQCLNFLKFSLMEMSRNKAIQDNVSLLSLDIVEKSSAQMYSNLKILLSQNPMTNYWIYLYYAYFNIQNTGLNH